MPGWRFWERKSEEPEAAPEPPATGRRLPPPRTAAPAANPEHAEKLAQLRKRREQLGYDLERAETAIHPENAWTERIALLDESLETIATDLSALKAIAPLPAWQLPPVPVTDVSVRREEPSEVAFAIGGERFHFLEETDWDQRGGPVVRGDLQQQAGDATQLVPLDAPDGRREELAQHLVESVIVLATDLRDRALEGRPLPEAATLADLAEPCPACGNWREWGGVCDTCAQRAYRKQRLNAEALRIEKERAEQVEDRHKWAERLPVARRRMADLDASIAALLEDDRRR